MNLANVFRSLGFVVLGVVVMAAVDHTVLAQERLASVALGLDEKSKQGHAEVVCA